MTGRPRRRKDAPETGGEGAASRPRPLHPLSPGPRHPRPPSHGGRLPGWGPAAPQSRASGGATRVAGTRGGAGELCRRGGAPGRAAGPASSTVRPGLVRRKVRRPPAKGAGPPPGTPAPVAHLHGAQSARGPGEQRRAEAERGQGRCPLGSSCSSSRHRRRRGVSLPQPGAERSRRRPLTELPRPPALRLTPPARLLRAGASPLCSALPLSAADARPRLKYRPAPAPPPRAPPSALPIG